MPEDMHEAIDQTYLQGILESLMMLHNVADVARPDDVARERFDRLVEMSVNPHLRMQAYARWGLGISAAGLTEVVPRAPTSQNRPGQQDDQ